MSNAWYVVVSRPQQEARAYAHFVAQGFDAFLPLGRKLDERPKPLFPGYLFFRPEDKNYGPIMNTRGVSRILSTPDGFPVPVRASVIDEIKSRAHDGVVPLKVTSAPHTFEKGQKVWIADGPFESLGALFVALRGERAEIVLDISGPATKVTVNAKSLVSKA